MILVIIFAVGCLLILQKIELYLKKIKMYSVFSLIV